jgi:hypothetical protein
MQFKEAKKMLIESARLLGYGAAMNAINRAWQKDLGGLKGAAFSVGPCEAEMVDCDCDNKLECDWCCGTGRVTEKVLEVKHSMK